MNRFLVSITLAVALLLGVGCMTAPIRTVTDNMFYSDKSPKIALQISGTYSYLGNIKQSRSQAWGDHAAIVDYSTDCFGATKDKELVSGLVLRAEHIGEGFWKNTCYGKGLSIDKVGNEKFCTVISTLSGANLVGSLKTNLQARGLTHSKYYIMKVFTHRSPYQSQDAFRVIYFEKTSAQFAAQYTIWFKSKGPMTEIILDTLNAFEDRADSAFKILPFN